MFAMTTSSPLQAVTPEERKSRLALATRQEVAAGGRVESQTDYTAIVRFEKPVNHEAYSEVHYSARITAGHGPAAREF
jgi:hypothetical protein